MKEMFTNADVMYKAANQRRGTKLNSTYDVDAATAWKVLVAVVGEYRAKLLIDVHGADIQAALDEAMAEEGIMTRVVYREAAACAM